MLMECNNFYKLIDDGDESLRPGKNVWSLLVRSLWIFRT